MRYWLLTYCIRYKVCILIFLITEASVVTKYTICFVKVTVSVSSDDELLMKDLRKKNDYWDKKINKLKDL